MSWEVWGTPPDPEPGPEPDPDWMAPQIGPRQQWCCARGCGPCQVKTVLHVWREVRDRHGALIEQNTTPVDVSSCCGSELELWDEDERGFVPWEPVVREPANAEFCGGPAGPSKSQDGGGPSEATEGYAA